MISQEERFNELLRPHSILLKSFLLSNGTSFLMGALSDNARRLWLLLAPQRHYCVLARAAGPGSDRPVARQAKREVNHSFVVGCGQYGWQCRCSAIVRPFGAQVTHPLVVQTGGNR